MKLWSIQILRFVAALGVAAFHAAWWTTNHTGAPGVVSAWLAQVGAAGVDLFFVISGFIIAKTSKGLSAGEFVTRRARRIVPLYWLAVAPFVATRLFDGAFDWRDGLASVALWPATDQMTAPALTVGWTLCFEALFYAAFALVLWRRWVVAPVLAVFGLCLALRSGPIPDFIGNPLVLEFLLGVGLAQLPPFRPALWAGPVGVALLLRFAPYAGLPGKTDVDFLVGDDNWKRLIAFGLPSALLVWGALQVEVREGIFTCLGDASYAIYLFHVPIVVGAGALMIRYTDLPTDAVVAVSTAAAVLIGWRVHVLFEQPILAFLSRRQAAPEVARA